MADQKIIDFLKSQILAQNTTSKWSGEGFGSAEANAADMAKILDSIGITDISQFGVRRVEKPVEVAAPAADTGESGGWMTVMMPTDEYYNKVTGQAVPNTYGERQTGNAWGGTFAGSGNTGYRVQFDSAGNPYFYTTGASSSDVGSILPIASLALSFAVPGLGAAIGSALGASGVAATALGNAVIGGVMSEASGGDFLQGALTSGAGSLLGGVVNPAVTEAVGSQAVSNALTSGALAELQGGDFAQGALSGALSGAVSDAKLAAAEEYLQSLPGGYDYENVLAPTEADVLSSISGDYQIELPIDVAAPVQVDATTIQTPTLTANDVVSLISGETSGLAQNISNLESQLTAQGQDFMDYLQQQGLDYNTALNEAIAAQGTEFGTALNQTTEDILSQLASQGTGLQTEFQSGLSGLAEQLGTTTEDLQNQLVNAQESWSGQLSSGLSSLEGKLTTQGKDFMDYLQQQGLDYETALNEAISAQGSEFGTALNQTTEDLINQISGVQTGLESQLTSQGKDLMDALQQQGLDYNTALNEAIAAQETNFGTALNQTTEDILSQLALQETGLQTEFQSGLSNLAEQLGTTTEDLRNQLANAQESWSGQLSSGLSSLESQLTTQGKDFVDYLQQQGLDYQTALNEAIAAQETNFGTALNQTTEDILSQLASQGTGLQTEFNTGISNLAEQLGTTTEDLQNQLANAQESWSGQLSSGLSGLESQLTTQGKDFMDYLKQQGLDYETALNEAIATQGSEFGTALNQTTQDLINQISGVQTGLESQLTQQGKDLMDYFQQQGLDYETALNEAISAQGYEFGTALNQTTEDILAQLAEQGTGLQTEFQTGLQDLADQLGISQQELQDQLNQYQEDWGTQLSGVQTGLESQLSGLESSLAESTLANKLAMLDAMKAIGGLGLSLTGINSVMKSIQDQVTPKTYEFTPVDTSGWKSPVAAQPVSWQAPTPINFGSRELLKGTQWQSPVNIGQVINTLNSAQPAPFVMPSFMSTFQGAPTVGTGEIIGELGGKPVSIADIVAGIQSGQTYPSTMG